MLSPGIELRKIRDRLGLTMRDVENASVLISQRHGSEEYLVPPSRLSDIETKGVVPSIYRLYSLAGIYHQSVSALLDLYGIDLAEITTEWATSQPARSHVVSLGKEHGALSVPVRMDPGFDLRDTTDLGRMIQQWGTVPLTMLNQLASQDYTYAYIGTEDYTMYPILQPGSLVQVDESRKRVVERRWRSEYERPIYFVEMRDGFTCCWCSFRHNALVLQPHPLSSTPVRVLRHPQEAEVIGQVVAVAMRIGDLAAAVLPEPRVLSESRSNAVLSSSPTLKAATGTDHRSVSMRKKLE